MKPFLLIQSREDIASDDEHKSFAKFSGLEPDQLIRCRIENGDMPDINLDDYSGIIMGGGPWNVSDQEKSPAQAKAEEYLFELFDEIVARDFPFIGVCYGVSLLTKYLGGSISREFSEPVSGVTVTLTEEGQRDPITEDLNTNFTCIVGHKEAADALPNGATLLATTPACPTQMFRVKKNIYATYFHPELDSAALILRLKAYQNHGYFPPEELDELVTMAEVVDSAESTRILHNFVKLATEHQEIIT
jgi:GMP synthase (glutamine-hydrolysing)